jgi:predicted transcriptional regulator
MRDAVLKTIKELGPVKAGNIAHSIGVDSAEIVNELRELRADGLIQYASGKYSAVSEEKLLPAIQALNDLEGKLNTSVKPLTESLLKHAVLNRLSALLHDDISAVLESIADDLEEYQKVGEA